MSPISRSLFWVHSKSGLPQRRARSEGRISRLLTQAKARAGARVAIVEQVQTPRLLIGLADGIGRPCQRRHTAQETPIRLMRIRHRAKAFPAVAAQLVQSAVIPRPRVGVA